MQRNYPDAPDMPMLVDDIDNNGVFIECALHLVEELDKKLPDDPMNARMLNKKIHTLLTYWLSNHDCLMGDLIYKIDWKDIK